MSTLFVCLYYGVDMVVGLLMACHPHHQSVGPADTDGRRTESRHTLSAIGEDTASTPFRL
jgi:hypothetical protein